MLSEYAYPLPEIVRVLLALAGLDPPVYLPYPVQLAGGALPLRVEVGQFWIVLPHILPYLPLHQGHGLHSRGLQYGAGGMLVHQEHDMIGIYLRIYHHPGASPYLGVRRHVEYYRKIVLRQLVHYHGPVLQNLLVELQLTPCEAPPVREYDQRFPLPSHELYPLGRLERRVGIPHLAELQPVLGG